MLWFKLPSNLCLKADSSDRYVIIEYACLYAQLEREPTEKELSRHLTKKQQKRLAEWLPSLREQLSKDLREAKNNRKSSTVFYEKSAPLSPDSDSQSDSQSDCQSDGTRKEEKESITLPKGRVIPHAHTHEEDTVSLPSEFASLSTVVAKWLNYKKSRRENYKSSDSIRLFAKKLWGLSGGDVSVADAIVEQSMANNWAGVFALKVQSSGPPVEDPYDSSCYRYEFKSCFDNKKQEAKK